MAVATAHHAETKPRKVGLPSSLTSHWRSVKVLEHFLRNAGIQVVKTPKTTPDILLAGTTYCSADFCIPVRVHVGHIQHLAATHPDLDFIIAPSVCSEDTISKTCSKYHDIAGIARRSIAGSVGYVARLASEKDRRRLAGLLGEDRLGEAVAQAALLPPLLVPEVHSLERSTMRNLCYSLYCDIMGIPKLRGQAEMLLPAALRKKMSSTFRHVEEAFETAYSRALEESPHRLQRFLADQTKPRVAIVGRVYLYDDPLITSDLKRYFQQHGCSVITPEDVPFSRLEERYRRVNGFYDTHRLYDAFIDFIADQVDGFIVIGSFGCHPDAFQNEYHVEYVRRKGLPAWLFKYDEQSGSAGFKTRYETILGFLERRRDQRLARRGGSPCPPEPVGEELAPPEVTAPAGDAGGASSAPTNSERRTHNLSLTHGGHTIVDLQEVAAALPPACQSAEREPVLIWPHMSPIVDLLVEEVFHQAGLSRLTYPPSFISEDTIEVGNYKYTESCCPYAFSTGSLIQTVRRHLDGIEREARVTGRPVRPRRFVLLQGRGVGPCTYGWYSQLQATEMPRMFAKELAQGNHAMEMATVGLTGAGEFIAQLSRLGDARKLEGILRFVDASAGSELQRASPEARQAGSPAGKWRAPARTPMGRLGAEAPTGPGGLPPGALPRALPWAVLARKRPLARGATPSFLKKWSLLFGLMRAIGGLTKTGWAKLDAAEDIRGRVLILRAHERKRGETTRCYKECLRILGEAHSVEAIRKAHQECLARLEAIERDCEIKPRVLVVGEIYVVLASFANRGTMDNLLGAEGIEVVEGLTLGHFLRTSLGEMKRRALVKKPGIRQVLQFLNERNFYPWQRQDRGKEAKPFMAHDVGGDGICSVAEARTHIEKGIDGIVHLYPFKCMPEMTAKDALREVADFYGVRYLPLPFDKETDTERLRTEVSTFAALLRMERDRQISAGTEVSRSGGRREIARRRRLGRSLNRIYRAQCSYRYTSVV